MPHLLNPHPRGVHPLLYVYRGRDQKRTAHRAEEANQEKFPKEKKIQMTTVPLSLTRTRKSEACPYALIDDQDAERVLAKRWTAKKDRGARELGGDRVDLASFILGVGPEKHIVYRNGNRYDCRRENLVVEARSHQTQRAEIPTGGTGFRGVCRDRRDGRFDVYIKQDYRRRYLGRFDTAEAAAQRYDDAALELYGESARLNFPAVS